MVPPRPDSQKRGHVWSDRSKAAVVIYATIGSERALRASEAYRLRTRKDNPEPQTTTQSLGGDDFWHRDRVASITGAR